MGFSVYYLIEEEILITHYQRWQIYKSKEHSKSKRASSLAPKNYRQRKLQPALDSTKKLGSVSNPWSFFGHRCKRPSDKGACHLQQCKEEARLFQLLIIRSSI